MNSFSVIQSFFGKNRLICVEYLVLIHVKCFRYRYWPVIDNALRAAAIDRRVSVKLLISWWNHSRPAEDYFLNSLQVISNSYRGVDVQVVFMIFIIHKLQHFSRYFHAKQMKQNSMIFFRNDSLFQRQKIKPKFHLAVLIITNTW